MFVQRMFEIIFATLEIFQMFLNFFFNNPGVYRNVYITHFVIFDLMIIHFCNVIVYFAFCTCNKNVKVLL